MTTLRSGLCAFVIVAAFAIAPGCSCSTPREATNICALPSPPSGCGAMCNATLACRAGTHCVGGSCQAECSATHPCANRSACAADGTCATGVDAGSRPDGSGIDLGFTPVDANLPPTDTTCAAVQVGAQMATPNVIVIVDESGSMGQFDFPPGSGVTRWDALEMALMSPSGIINTLQGSVRWGMAWFHGGNRCPNNTGTVACALNNYTAINTRYRSLAPGGGTPTGEAISLILSQRAMLISDPNQPTIFILATDGDPNGCGAQTTAQGMMTTLAAIDSAFSMGINTYVIGVGDATSANLQLMANAGIGSSGSTSAMWWQPTDTTSLSAALSTIVGGVRSCNLTLAGMIDVTQACSGSVTLAGMNLACNGPDGWHAVDATHIAVDGNACTQLLGGVTPLIATFPCGVVIM